MSNKTNVEDSNKDKETYQASEGNTNTEKPLEVTIESEINKEKTDKIDSKEFKCSKCEYMWKTRIKFKKHVYTKHAEHECKLWKLKLKTAIESLKYTAQDHSSNII